MRLCVCLFFVAFQCCWASTYQPPEGYLILGQIPAHIDFIQNDHENNLQSGGGTLYLIGSTQPIWGRLTSPRKAIWVHHLSPRNGHEIPGFARRVFDFLTVNQHTKFHYNSNQWLVLELTKVKL